MRRILVAALAVVSAAVLAPAAAADVTPMTGWGRFEIISKDLNNATVRAFRNVNGLTPPTYGGPVTIGTGWLDSTHFVKFGDLNGDSYDEMISVGIYTQQVIAYRNRGDGTYENPGILVGQGWNHPAGTYFADINGDYRDEIVGLQGNGELWAWPNTKGLTTDTYATGRVVIGTGWSNAVSTYFADINGDNRDEVISLRDHGEIWAWRNVNGAYTAGYQVIGTGWPFDPRRIKFGDINGDRRHELIDVRSNGEVWAWPNVNGLNGFPYTQAPVLIGLGWSNPDRVFFAEIMS